VLCLSMISLLRLLTPVFHAVSRVFCWQSVPRLVHVARLLAVTIVSFLLQSLGISGNALALVSAGFCC
jgi:hypothetical protein